MRSEKTDSTAQRCCAASSTEGFDAAAWLGAAEVLAAAWRFAAGEQNRFLPARLASYSA